VDVLADLVRQAEIADTSIRDQQGRTVAVVMTAERYAQRPVASTRDQLAAALENGKQPKRKPTRGERKRRQRERIAAAKAAEAQRKRSRGMGLALKSVWSP
jgi:hypothetical protein